MKYCELSRRVNKQEREELEAKGLHVYDRRDCGRVDHVWESTIERHVAVDFIGTLVTDFEVILPDRGPNAGVIYNGDAYLKVIGAQQVWRLEEMF